MQFPVIVGLVLSLIVLYWPGRPAPQWVRDWLNRLWSLLGITLLAGIALSFYDGTSKLPAGGGFHISVSRAPAISYTLTAVFIALMLLTLLGAAHVAVAVARGWSIPRTREAWRAATAGIQRRKLWVSLAVALCALAVGLTLGTPVTVTSEGISDPWGLAINVVAAVVLFTALGSAWSAVKPALTRP